VETAVFETFFSLIEDKKRQKQYNEYSIFDKKILWEVPGQRL